MAATLVGGARRVGSASLASVVGTLPAVAFLSDAHMQALVAALCVLASAGTQLCLVLTKDAYERRAERRENARLRAAGRLRPTLPPVDVDGDHLPDDRPIP